MAIDRVASLKKAEKLLRQGRLEGAIGEDVRLVEDHPLDWNAVNALGDLYVRVGAADRAVTQFLRGTDQLFGEGLLSRAAALYKKALKVGGHHDHALLRLGEVAWRQGLVTDAKAYLDRLAEQRRLRGDQRGAAECLARLDALPESGAASPVTSPSVTQSQGEDPDVQVAFVQMELASEKSERAHTVLVGTARMAVATAPAGVPDAVRTEEALEVDLSEMLADLSAAPSVSLGGAVVEPPAVEPAFAEVPPPVSQGSAADAAALYDRGLGHVQAGRSDEAVADLREAALTLSLRFQAAAELGRLHLTRGESQAGVDWMARASESPALTPEEGWALLYELAMVLERLGETARALAVLRELHAGAGRYLDVESRIARLMHAQARGNSG